MSAWRVRAVLAMVVALVCAAPRVGEVMAQRRGGVVMGTPPPPGPRPDGSGGLRGRVIDGATGEPLRGARMTVTWQALEGSGSARFSTRSDAQGAFAFERLPDGVYFVQVQRQGHFELPGAFQSQRQVTLRGGASIDLGDMRLMRGGILTGRVVDQHGEPVVGARVTPIGRPPGQDVLMPLGGGVTTDDRGVYRAHGLMPATYTVRVVPLGPSSRGAVRLQGDEPETLSGFATNAPEPSAAEFVDVRAGEEAMLDVRLSAGRLSRVTGQVVVLDEPGMTARPMVSLHPVAPGLQVPLANAQTRPDGRFEFQDVAPGRYRVVAEEPMLFTSDGFRRRRAGWAETSVTDDPVVEVDVPIGFGAVVRGRVEVEGGEPSALAERPLHLMAPAVATNNPLTSSSAVSAPTDELSFELQDVLGYRQLQVTGLPTGWWLKSVLIDGEEAFDGHLFPVSGTVDGVVLLVSARVSGISGRVHGAGGLQGASVVVLPNGNADRTREPAISRRMAGVSADGTFTAPSLRPGRYTLVALSPSMRSAYDRLDLAQRQALVDRHGRAVDVVEGRLVTVSLQMVER